MKTILVITDGIGYSQQTQYNAFHHAKKPTYDYLFKNVPYSMIDTFGLRTHFKIPSFMLKAYRIKDCYALLALSTLWY